MRFVWWGFRFYSIQWMLYAVNWGLGGGGEGARAFVMNYCKRSPPGPLCGHVMRYATSLGLCLQQWPPRAGVGGPERSPSRRRREEGGGSHLEVISRSRRTGLRYRRRAMLCFMATSSFYLTSFFIQHASIFLFVWNYRLQIAPNLEPLSGYINPLRFF